MTPPRFSDQTRAEASSLHLGKQRILLSPGEIAAIAEIPRNTVDKTLARMTADGEVVQVSRGRYAHPDKEFATPVTSVISQKGRITH